MNQTKFDKSIEEIIWENFPLNCIKRKNIEAMNSKWIQNKFRSELEIEKKNSAWTKMIRILIFKKNAGPERILVRYLTELVPIRFKHSFLKKRILI